MNWRSVDLNLLLLFEALFQERSVTRAGERIGLSQSAMSHGLSRLRRLLRDELFVRTPAGMEPTAIANAMALPVRRAIDELKTAFQTEPFDLATAQRTIKSAFNHYSVVVLASQFVKAVTTEAPYIHLDIKPRFALPIVDMLDRADLDLAVVEESIVSLGDRFVKAPLIEDYYVAVTQKTGKDKLQQLTLNELSERKYLIVSSVDQNVDFLDDMFASAGIERRADLSIPYLAAARVLEDSNMFTVLGRRVAEHLCNNAELQIHELPSNNKIPPIRIEMVWPRRLNTLPYHQWIRRKLIETATNLGSASIESNTIQRL